LWLILCHNDDPSALWAYEGLQQRGLAPLKLVTAEMLVPSLRWDHRVGAHGASIEISFSDEQVLSSYTVHGVLNRLTGPSRWYPLHRVAVSDRSYAGKELTAFFLSWLSCLPSPILNRPTPQGLAGRERHGSEWVLLATTAGLTTVSYRQSSRTSSQASIHERSTHEGTPSGTVLVIDRYVFGVAPPPILDACQRLANLANTTILGVDFTVSTSDQWTFTNATPLPDLRLGGQPALDALAEALLVQRREE
jgi:hypothetical protein